MNKIFLQLLVIVSIYSTAAMASAQYAVGEARYLSVSHSHSLDIIAPKFAEARALQNAVNEIVEICNGDNFTANNFEYRHDHFTSFPQSIVSVAVEFECR